MPALAPVCARAGRPASATAAAVATAIAREAGFTGPSLLGDRAAIMSGRVSARRSRGANYGCNGPGSTRGRRVARSQLRVRKPAEYGISGAMRFLTVRERDFRAL